jgi:hypothetical protein
MSAKESKMTVGLKSCQSDWSGRSGVSKRLVSRKHGIEVLSVKFGQIENCIARHFTELLECLGSEANERNCTESKCNHDT